MDTRFLRRKRCQPRRGQALVEYALVLGIVLLISLGAIDFARLFFTWSSMANAAREGARFGTVHPTWWTSADHTPNIEGRTRALLYTLGTDTPQVEIHCFHAHGQAYGDSRAYCTKGNQIHVIVRARFRSWTPIIPVLNLSATATMVIE